MVWNAADDRSGSSENRDQDLASSALWAWADGLGLTDVWRVTNPSVKDYTVPFSLPNTNPPLELTTYLHLQNSSMTYAMLIYCL